MKLSRLKTRRQRIANREVSSSIYMPYSCHWNSNTLLTKNNDFLSIIKVNGFSFETADDEDVDSKKDIRNNLFKGLAGGKFTLYFHTIRRKHSAYPEGRFENPFCRALNHHWQLKHNPKYTFVNEHYVTIIRKNNKVTQFFDTIASKLNRTESQAQESEKSLMLDAYHEFSEVRDRILNSLAPYKASILGAHEDENGVYSEILTFLGTIANCFHRHKYLVPTHDIDKYIQSTRLHFGRNSIEATNPKGSNHAAIVSLKNYRPSTYAGILDNFLHLPCEFVITQSFSYIDKSFAVNKMQLQQRRLIQSEDPSVSQIAEISEALDSAVAGEYAFGYHHLTVMCIGETKKELDDLVSHVNVEFTNIGIQSVRESINMEACFWGQFPGNQDYIVRKSIINTLNLAGFAAFHNYPEGKIKENHWGDAVTVFNTTSGTPYFFNFHVRDVGHTMIIGPTGAGKTVLMNFLCAQAQKFRPRMFFFDKDRGAEIFISAIGGKYAKLDVTHHSGFNPLQLEDIHTNRTFLSEWLQSLVTSNGEQITAEDIDIINQAIEGNYRLPRDQRRLSNLSAFFGTEGPDTLAGRLAQWHSDGPRAKLFDNPQDLIDFDSSRLFGFEMGEILQDKVALGPALLYLFHRINNSLNGSNTMIVLDEAWALIDNQFFAPKIKNWLKVLRKLNAIVIFATQSVEDATKSDISDTLVQQTATQIFLPNLKATEIYQKVFMLSDREFSLIKNTDPSTRFFLVKQDNNAVVTRVNLSGNKDIINVLSGRVSTVTVMDEMKERYGTDPVSWLQPFLDAIRDK